jgi:hypothetical protein
MGLAGRFDPDALEPERTINATADVHKMFRGHGGAPRARLSNKIHIIRKVGNMKSAARPRSVADGALTK